MGHPLARLSQHLKGFSHWQALERLRDVTGFAPHVIYDIGAYHGRWTRAARRVFPAARYLLFEANADNEIVLRASGERYFIAALSREEGREVDFYRPAQGTSATGSSLYREQTVHYRDACLRAGRVVTRRLDALVAQQDCPQPDLIKLDVQGSELDVLQGAGALLATCAALVVEIALVQSNAGAPLAAECMAGINDFGFKCVDICKVRRTSVGNAGQVDLLFVNAPLYETYRRRDGLL